jgi:hypothetical protein
MTKQPEMRLGFEELEERIAPDVVGQPGHGNGNPSGSAVPEGSAAPENHPGH